MNEQAHLARGIAQEKEVMKRVENRHGLKLQALTDLRDLAVTDLQSLKWTEEQFNSYPSILVLLLSEAIGLLDLIRIALEHGYGRRSRILIRSLMDAEIDTALLSTEDRELLFRYGAYEAWELAAKAAGGLPILGTGNKVEEGVQIRKKALLEALQFGERQIPADFDKLDLKTTAEYFGQKVFGRKYPSQWRMPLTRQEWLDIAIPVIVAADNPTLSDIQSDFEAACESAILEYKFGYTWCSEAVHVSPRTIVDSLKYDASGTLSGFIVAGNLGEIASSLMMAALHFSRLRQVVTSKVNLATPRDSWDKLFEVLAV